MKRVAISTYTQSSNKYLKRDIWLFYIGTIENLHYFITLNKFAS
jgi:hypothetical protein